VESRIAWSSAPWNPSPDCSESASRGRLTTHWLYPLYATFFAELGIGVVLSDVDPAGWLKANSGFCFPVQIAHSAVLDLVKHDIKLISSRRSAACPTPWGREIPISARLPRPALCHRQGLPEATLLAPVLDFTAGTRPRRAGGNGRIPIGHTP